MKFLYLDSNKSVNNRFSLDKRIEGKYKLVSVCFTNNIYNVNDTNNKIYINENGTDIECSLTNGFYNPSELKTHVSEILNNNLSGSVSVSLNENTNKLTITNTITFYFTFGSNTNNSAFKLLGFRQEDGTTNTSQTSNNAIDLNNYKNIFINISENDNKYIEGTEYFTSSFMICGMGSFGENFTYIHRDYPEQYVKFRSTKNLTIKIHDYNNNNIDINSEYALILQKCKNQVVTSISESSESSGK